MTSDCVPHQMLVAALYEKKFDQSLSAALNDKCGSRLYFALSALLIPTADFIAMRLHDAMEGWFTNKDVRQSCDGTSNDL